MKKFPPFVSVAKLAFLDMLYSPKASIVYTHLTDLGIYNELDELIEEMELLFETVDYIYNLKIFEKPNPIWDFIKRIFDGIKKNLFVLYFLELKLFKKYFMKRSS